MCGFVLLTGLCAAPEAAFPASHEELTVVPLGRYVIPQGPSKQQVQLPSGASGPLNQALVFMATQPTIAVKPAAPLIEGQEDDSAQEEADLPRQYVPATVRFTVGGKKLPDWPLYEFGTAYVISRDVLRGAPGYETGWIEVSAEVDSIAERVNCLVFGMPDPLMVSESLCGPIAVFHENAKSDEQREYFVALAHELAGHKQEARATYQKLASSRDERLARFARRGLRLLQYDLRKHKLSGNFRENYNWGLYLQECGLFGPAFHAYDEARLMFPLDADAEFRAGEMLDRIQPDPYRVFDYMDDAIEGFWQTEPIRWSILLVIARSRDSEHLSGEQLTELKAAWVLARRMIGAATGGFVDARGVVLEIDEENDCPMEEYPGGLIAPSHEIVGGRGWFDSVFYIRPRLESETKGEVRTIGGRDGPKGAGLSMLYADATWREFMRAWYAQFHDAAQRGEVDPALPSPEAAADCGHSPIPGLAYGARSAIRYEWSPEVIRRVKAAPRGRNSEHLRMWRIEGPFDASPSTGGPGTDPADRNTTMKEAGGFRAQSIVSPADFIDLDRILPDARPARARATTWVYSPADQDCRMWIGGAGEIAVHVNGRPVYRGRDAGAFDTRWDARLDAVASYAPLIEGWNELRVIAGSPTAVDSHRWGFSVRLCDAREGPVPGLAFLASPPEGDPAVNRPTEVGRHYEWERVRRSWASELPTLTARELQAITGTTGLTVHGEARAGGCVSIQLPGAKEGATYRSPPSSWKSGQDRDVTLNNLLDWDRESCLAIRYQRNGRERDILFVRPASLMAYMTLLGEPSAAAEMFAGRRPDQRLLGCLLVDDGAGGRRRLFAVECLLGLGGAWPTDEEDLLHPILDEYIPNPRYLQPTLNTLMGRN